MYKKILSFVAILAFSLSVFAQSYPGGVKGTVVNRVGRLPVADATLTLFSGTNKLASASTDAKGDFYIPNLDNGMYMLVIEAPDFVKMQVNVTVNDGYVKNMFTLSLTPSQKMDETDVANLAEFDMEDSGYEDNPTVLFNSNDVFNNTVGYNFSPIRFKVRGYSSESQDVLLAGVKMNDAMTGYTPYSLWSGLNEATRTKESVTGTEVSQFGFGGYNGLTDIMAEASSMRSGYRFSVLSNSAFYRLRLMGSYASGMLDNGWSYAFNFSARLGGNDWIKGVYYRSFGYYGAVEKKFDDANKLGFVFMAAPGERGAQNGSTQEVYDLVGDNMYNSNWGYQDGKVRNSRVRKTHEPIAILKYDFTPGDKFQGSATVLYRFGKNGYTALDWYDAPDPRPDYYRNLPSYFYMENSDYNRRNYPKYVWAKEAWTGDYAPTTHIDWDRLYSVNEMNADTYGNRSKYIQEERRVDQRDLNFAASFKWRPYSWLTVDGGANAKINRTENYKIIADLLGGDYYLNIDQFAERDYSSSPAKVQNDLDYYMEHGSAQVLGKGDKYGYDYYAQIRKAGAWMNGAFSLGDLSGNIAGKVGYTNFWRDGLVRKGLFAGLDKNGKEIVVDGDNLTSYDPVTGDVITSYGKSDKSDFFTYAAKAGLNYVLGGKMRFYGNIGYFNDAPSFKQAFVSPRTRNSLVRDLTTVKTFSTDLNYQFSSDGYDVRVTGYYTTIKDQTDVMSFYDDLQNSFTNFAMSGIDERHMGLEVGFKVPTPVDNLSLKGVLSYGKYEYTSNPYMTQTVDNSADVTIDHQFVPYWKKTPVFSKDASGSYVTDASGNYVIDHYKQHYVSGSPQLASSLGLSWNRNYWFIDADVNYFADSYLEMNPLYRTDMAVAGPDGKITPAEVEYMTSQEKFDPAFLVNFSIGKSWFIQWKYQVGVNLQVNNLLNNKDVKTGGYEQTRLVDNTVGKERYYRFDPKYFYMCGINYMLNIYFRF
ncbi:MAG: carboxypeptidase-like regulatory domain-containing protein [Bacteroidales bacterium]|jgi:hypothetical protein|nr:carboxypeptidase-like regulatory domain-containing protein [Bacteroidales bacterium]MCI1784670.1 carboxypeptidase-like regulatory domain-containing protein [Bacteroidales bacterium]